MIKSSFGDLFVIKYGFGFGVLGGGMSKFHRILVDLGIGFEETLVAPGAVTSQSFMLLFRS